MELANKKPHQKVFWDDVLRPDPDHTHRSESAQREKRRQSQQRMTLKKDPNRHITRKASTEARTTPRFPSSWRWMEIKTLPLGEAIKTQKRIRPLSCGYRAGIARARAGKPEAVKIPCRGAWTCTREEPPNPLLSNHEQFRRRGEGRRRSNGWTGGVEWKDEAFCTTRKWGKSSDEAHWMNSWWKKQNINCPTSSTHAHGTFVSLFLCRLFGKLPTLTLPWMKISVSSFHLWFFRWIGWWQLVSIRDYFISNPHRLFWFHTSIKSDLFITYILSRIVFISIKQITFSATSHVHWKDLCYLSKGICRSCNSSMTRL